MNEVLFCMITFVYTIDSDEVDIVRVSGWEINCIWAKGLFLTSVELVTGHVFS